MTKVYIKLNNDERLRHYIFWWLTSLMLLNSVFYLFFINFGVSEILVKKETLYKIQNIKEENQNLEGKYLEQFKKLSVNYAKSLGYVNSETNVFLNRTAIVARANQEIAY